MAGQDQFEAFFRRADLDGDGKISGAEAVSFFQGSNLPKQVLAQIWTYADQSRSGFLGRAEFYNALKLVTVAQSKRDLTPEIVKAALYGPAAAKIPPPQINLSATPVNRATSISGPAPPSQISTMPIPTASQNLGFRGPGVPSVGMNQQYFPAHQNLSMRPPQAVSSGIASLSPQNTTGIVGQSQAMPTSTAPLTIAGATGRPQAMPTGAASHPPQSLPGATPGLGISNSNLSNNWLSGQASSGVAGPRGISASITTGALPQALASVTTQSSASDSKAPAVSGNGVAGNLFFGGDVFSAVNSTITKEPSGPSHSATSMPMSSPSVPMSSGIQSSMKSNSLDSLQSAFAMHPLSSQPTRVQSLPNLGQQDSAPASSSIATSGISGGTVNSSDSQISWPKMRPTDIQKYTKVFMEVDTDRDGRITGEQARNLFLSWRLPRDVLKQVWDLSDQDSDSMLSLREFCFSLYLMERYREGRPLPSALPSNVMFDETLLSMTGQQPRVAYGNSAWGPNPGFVQQPGMSARPMAPAAGLRPPVPVGQSQPGASTTFNQQKSGGTMLENSFLNQHDGGDQNSVNSVTQDPGMDKKVNEPEKVILDSKEKIEYYRTKMQELVLYKSRCDNKLNEITERALADKREADMLGKKYEEKYKQVAEVASKLTIEEATFREMQGRKMELNQAIVNVEQGGSADGLLQVRGDRIQSDLDELMKALTERSKKHGLEVKSATLIELPVGWQPGIQEAAATWDEDWDKFEDEGFSNDLTVDVKSVSASSIPNSHVAENGKAYADGSSTPDSFSNGNGNSGHFTKNGHGLQSEYADAHSEDELVRSPQGSPAGTTSLESRSPDFSDVFVKSTEAEAEAHRGFDDSAWGAFDTHDDVDSVWGFNPASTKDSNLEKQRDIFGADDFGLRPVRTESPSAESAFQKKSLFFEDSVPASPASRFGNSPRYSEAGDHFDNYSRFDAFSTHEGGFSPREKLTRFDSINSTKDFGQSRTFSSFDESDPFGSSGPFRVSSDHETPKKGSENWGSF